jgi:hypothetical protein
VNSVSHTCAGDVIVAEIGVVSSEHLRLYQVCYRDSTGVAKSCFPFPGFGLRTTRVEPYSVAPVTVELPRPAYGGDTHVTVFAKGAAESTYFGGFVLPPCPSDTLEELAAAEKAALGAEALLAMPVGPSKLLELDSEKAPNPALDD